MTRLTLDQRLTHLRALLDQRPLHVFAAEPGSAAVPAGIGLFDLGGVEVVDPVTALERVGPRHRPVAISAWARAQQSGMTSDDVELADGTRALVSVFDFRDRGGVFIGVAVLLGPAGRTPPPAAPCRMARFRVDGDGRMVAIGDDVRRLLSLPVCDVRGRHAVDSVHPDDRAAGIGVWAAVLSAPGRPHRLRHRLRHGDGRWLWCESTLVSHLDDAADPRVEVEVVDVSAEMAEHDAVHHRGLLLAQLAESLPVGVVQLDGDRRVTYANARVHDLVGPDASLDALLALTLADDRPDLEATIDAALGDGEDREVEVRVARPAGGPGVYEVTLRSVTDRPVPGHRGVVPYGPRLSGAICCVSDVTERAEQRRRLEDRATRDGLTAAYNRDATVAALRRALEGRCGGEGVAVLFIDLDDFKRVNDDHGHGAGDRLLAVLAARLRATVRSVDVVGRIGGDEFLVVCPGVGQPVVARDLATRLAVRLAEPARLDDVILRPRASIGLAYSWDPTEDAEAVIARADAAMYDDKRSRARG
jgi:diguanylate cyclase (GGDEF)-like protein